MLLIFNFEKTLIANYNKEDHLWNRKRSDGELFPSHGALTPPSIIHFDLQIDKSEYDNSKMVLIKYDIEIEKEIICNDKEGAETEGITKSPVF